jgi:hypothetical protein
MIIFGIASTDAIVGGDSSRTTSRGDGSLQGPSLPGRRAPPKLHLRPVYDSEKNHSEFGQAKRKLERSKRIVTMIFVGKCRKTCVYLTSNPAGIAGSFMVIAL